MGGAVCFLAAVPSLKASTVSVCFCGLFEGQAVKSFQKFNLSASHICTNRHVYMHIIVFACVLYLDRLLTVFFYGAILLENNVLIAHHRNVYNTRSQITLVRFQVQGNCCKFMQIILYCWCTFVIPKGNCPNIQHMMWPYKGIAVPI